MRIDLPDAAATRALGRALGAGLAALHCGAVIELVGELGAGKTTLARAAIEHLGHDGPVVSPTYTLVEPYDLAAGRLYHLDLYRVADPEELEYLGLRERDPDSGWLLVEWAQRGRHFLPPRDLAITLTYGEHPGQDTGRHGELTEHSTVGEKLLESITNGMSDRSSI